MIGDNHNEPRACRLVRPLMTLSLTFAALARAGGVRARHRRHRGRQLKGEVHVTMNGAERAVRAGAVLELPATVRTGRDGSSNCRQGATTVSVGPDTLLEFPALEKRGGSIDRIVQPRGNAFYNIGKRDGPQAARRDAVPGRRRQGHAVQRRRAGQGRPPSPCSKACSKSAPPMTARSSTITAGEIASRTRGDRAIDVIQDGRRQVAAGRHVAEPGRAATARPASAPSDHRTATRSMRGPEMRPDQPVVTGVAWTPSSPPGPQCHAGTSVAGDRADAVIDAGRCRQPAGR